MRPKDGTSVDHKTGRGKGGQKRGNPLATTGVGAAMVTKRWKSHFLNETRPPDLRGVRLPTFCLGGTFVNKWLNMNFHR